MRLRLFHLSPTSKTINIGRDAESKPTQSTRTTARMHCYTSLSASLQCSLHFRHSKWTIRIYATWLLPFLWIRISVIHIFSPPPIEERYPITYPKNIIHLISISHGRTQPSLAIIHSRLFVSNSCSRSFATFCSTSENQLYWERG